MRELSLFTGAGGGLLASHLLGWTTVCGCEIDPYCRAVLEQRQRDGYIEPFPISHDIREFDGTQYQGEVDIVTGGFPCQDISSAGRRVGLSGDKSGLWYEMLRVVGEVEPAFVFAENSPDLRTRGLGDVLKGLASLGYDARWCVLGAGHVGAPHRRNRMWVLAYSNAARKRTLAVHGKMGGTSRDGVGSVGGVGAVRQTADPDRQKLRSPKTRERSKRVASVDRQVGFAGWAEPPPVERMDARVAHRMDRSRATGNGQVPQVAVAAWSILSDGLC